MNVTDSKLIKIGVFYDGNYFFHVSNFYHYSHTRRARLSIAGIQEFVRNRIAQYEGVDVKYCQVADSHYFRGRLSAQEADVRGKLYQERAFDDILMREGVVTHYLPLGPQGEKGIDVWLALEAFELAIFKRFNVLVLIACDGDYVPLVRKVHALGTRVMVLGWDFQYTDPSGNTRTTTTSIKLLEEASYPVLMHNEIDDKTKRMDSLIANLFVAQREPQYEAYQAPTPTLSLPLPVPAGDVMVGESGEGQIVTIKEGYGFIKNDALTRSIFFYWGDVADGDFNALRVGDRVQYVIGMNDRGECAKDVRKVMTIPREA